MISIFVTTKLQAGMGITFLEAMLENASASVRDEIGCLRFDVLRDESDSRVYYLYEIYSDQVSLDEHKKTEHYLKCRGLITPMIESQSVIRSRVKSVNPESAI